jgi:purine-nucleoside phosphorylase
MVYPNKNIIKNTVEFIKSRCNLQPRLGIILGSGLGGFADELKNLTKIPASEIPNYPRSTVEGHKGYLVFGYLDTVPILAIQGRTHYYEGYEIHEVAFVVRLMAELGIQILIVTNAAGSVNPHFNPGDLMIIVDHINFMFRNPLIGPVLMNEARWPDLYNVYDKGLSDIIANVGLELGIPLRKGVLFASTGPTYETAAEVKMAQKFGADAVSMSTVPEVLVARASKIKVMGISCITNMATGISSDKLSHDDVTKIAKQVRNKFYMLLKKVVQRLSYFES